MIFVNFKTYQQGTGGEAVKLAKACFQVQEGTAVKIFPVVQTADIFRVVQETGGIVWAQHVDDIGYGPNTGQILPEAIKAAGAVGTSLNHSENKLPLKVVAETIKHCRKLGLKTLVCSGSLEEANRLIGFAPDFLAYEPPELIGSRTVSVATAKLAVIKEFIKEIKNVPVLVGAGIDSQEDVRLSVRLGTVGVLVSSAVVLGNDPRKKLVELVEGFKN